MENAKNQKQSLWLILFSILIIGSALAVSYGVHQQSASENKELLGVIQTEQWVPFLILRDPPGNSSYTKTFLRNNDELRLVFLSGTNNVTVSGEFNSSLMSGAYSTSSEVREDMVLIVRLEQVWNVYRDEAGDDSNLALELVNCKKTSETHCISETQCTNRNAWITGPPPYVSGVNTGAGQHRFIYSRNQWARWPYTYVRAGFWLEFNQKRIRIRTALDVRFSTLETQIYIRDAPGGNRVTIKCDGPWERSWRPGGSVYYCSGLLIWVETR